MSDDVASEHSPGPWSRKGEILDGKFRLGEVLGRGGMGVVVAAHHLDLDEPVALKFLLAEAAESPTAIERFLREARRTTKLKSSHVTRVFDVGRTADNTPYIVMERLHGEDLSSRMRSRSFAVTDAVRIMLEVCEPLEEAHAQGIIHRDLKPQNIFLARAGGTSTVKLLDFGISRSTSNENALTRANELLGTPHFMSPEQYKDPRAAGARSDIYSLGACLYCILTRRPPFFGGDLLVLADKVINQPHTPIRDLRPDVPEALSRIIDRCLAKDPNDRFASANALRDALAPLAAPSAPVEHIDDETILAMQAGKLAASKLTRIEAHLAECDDCRSLVAIAGPSLGNAAFAPTKLALSSDTVTSHGSTNTSFAAAADAGEASTQSHGENLPLATLLSAEPLTISTPRAKDSRAPSTLLSADLARRLEARVAPSAPAPAPAPAPTPAARSSALVIVAAVLVLALVGVGGVAALRNQTEVIAPAAPVLPPPTTMTVPPPIPTLEEPVLPIVSAAVATASAPPPRVVTAPTKRPKRPITPTVKPGEIPNER